MKLIPLTQGQIAIVDNEDYEYLMQWKWFAIRHGRTHYAARHETTSSKSRLIRMHQALLPAPLGLEVDHVNHNGLDNRRRNLRLGTHAENMLNGQKRRGTHSRFRGVTRRVDIAANPWGAYIYKRVDGRSRRIHLGHFRSEVEAALVYDRAAREDGNELRQLNFPSEAPASQLPTSCEAK